MASEIDYQPFASLLSNVVDNRGRTCPTAPSGIPLIATNCVSNDSLYPSYDTVRYVDERTYRTWFRGHPEPGDFLFVLKGSPGRVCLVPDRVDFCIAQDMVAVRADSRRVYPKFLFALLRSEPVQRQIEQLHVGTMIPHFKKGDFDKLLLPLPTRAVQEYVGDLYWTFSQKIDVNRRMSQTLESMARALFKSWFVDFDPVRAKSEGCDTLLPAEVAAIFSDTLEDSDLGEIPSGWEISSLGALCDRITDGAHSSPASVDRGRPMGSVKDMQRWGFDVKGCRQISEADYQRLVRDDCRPRAGDVLIAKDGSFLKHIFVAEHDLDLVVLSSIAILRPNARIDAHLLAFSLLDDATNERMRQYVSGAVLQRIVLKDFRQIPMLVPPAELQRAWAAAVTPMLRRCWRQLDESDALASMRDALVPALFGQKTTKDAQPGGAAVPS